MSTGLPTVEELHRKVSLLQLQINRLLEITQAINDNLPKADLFKLYQRTLTWEMRIPRFALLSRNEEDLHWECPSHAGIEESLLQGELPIGHFQGMERATKVEMPEHNLLAHFDLVLPVHHKSEPIAYLLLGDLPAEDHEEMYADIRFISTITNIIAVAIENKRLFKRQLEQERLKRELELAVQVQNMLIPQRLPATERYEVAGVYQPHKGVGGDYYDFWEIDNEIAFCIADISGKGIAAALLMSNFQASLQSLVHRGSMHVRDFAEQLNSRVLRTTKGEKFITFFMARYSYPHRRLLYLNAGHNPPFLYTKNRMYRLDKGCTVLGAFPKLPAIEYGCIYLEEDAFFLLYTDGLTDLRNNQNEFMDDAFLEQTIRENAALSPSAFNAALLERANAFRQNQEFPDDISFLTAKIFVPKNR